MSRQTLKAIPVVILIGFYSLFGAGSASALTPPEGPAGLVFENGGRIVSIKADGSDRTVLTRRNAWVGQPWGISDNGPVVSPDGSKIMFNRYYDGFKDGIVEGVMVMNRDGSHLHRLYEPPEDTGTIAGAWASDGTRIYAIELHEESNPQGDYEATGRLLTMGLDGSDRETILTSVFRYREKDGSISGDRMFPIGVLVSPDGRLMIESVNYFEDVPNRLEWVDPDTGARTVFEKDASAASFSPDGGRIAFTSDRDRINVECYEGSCSGDPRIFIKDVETGTVERLAISKSFGSVWSPAWSPDGNRIAFASTHSPGSSYVGAEIWTVAPDGTCAVRLTNGSPASSDPQWFPEGSASQCHDLAPAPLGEITVASRATTQKPRPLWAGPSLRGWLVSDTFLDGQDLFVGNNDCGKPGGDCPAPISVSSGPVCSKNLSADLMMGRYLGMERLRGGLLVRNLRRKGIALSHFYSAGTETRVDSPGNYRERPVGFGYHRQVVGELRPVGSNAPAAGSLGAPVLAWTTVRKARAMVREFARTGSLRKSADAAGVFREKNFFGVAYRRKGAIAWLRFGRDLKRLGKVRSVKCRRWQNDPSTVAVRSRVRDYFG